MGIQSAMTRAPEAETGVIVSQYFCSSEPIDIVFSTNGRCLAVVDGNNDPIWVVKTQLRSLGGKQLMLLDTATGFPLLSLRRKFWSSQGRWQVFMGDSVDKKDLLFSVKKNSMFQFKTELNVFLTNKRSCDYKIKGSYDERTCTIYEGNSSMVVAQMSEEGKVDGVPMNGFSVAINWNTDSCFISALVAILHEIYQEASNAAKVVTDSSLNMLGKHGDMRHRHMIRKHCVCPSTRPFPPRIFDISKRRLRWRWMPTDDVLMQIY